MARSNGTGTKRFVAIDANSLIHRAFHAFPPDLATTDGTQVNAVYGFTSMLLKVLSELDPKYLVCAFDLKDPTFRHTEYVEYKGTRGAADSTLSDQFPLVRKVLKAFNVPMLQKKGFEADDILGTLAAYADEGRWKNENLEMVIVTGDKDLLQTVSERVHVWLPHGSFKDLHLYDRQEVEKRFGFGPEFIPDFKGLAGDASDNIPGVKGIGEKSASSLVSEFGHLEQIFEHIGELKDRQQRLLREGEESAVLSRKLAQVVKSVDLNIKLEDCLMRDFDEKAVVETFRQFEFRSLLPKIPRSVNHTGEMQIGLFEKTLQHKGDPVRQMSELDVTKLDAETAVFLAFLDPAVLMIGVEKGTSQQFYYASDLSDGGTINGIRELIDRGIPVTSFGWEPLCRALMKEHAENDWKSRLFDYAAENVFDIGLAAYHLSSGQRNYSLTTLSFTYAGTVLEEKPGFGKEETGIVIAVVKKIAEKLTNQLNEHSKTMGIKLTRGRRPLVYSDWRSIDTPLSVVLGDMTRVGVLMDEKGLEMKNKELDEKTGELEKQIFEAVGHEFNVASSRQLADVLFNELGLPVGKRRKTGPSTDESVLQKLSGMHPVIELVLAYREVVKMNNTYIVPLLTCIRTSGDGRVHSVFNQTGTSTGRLSSVDPNMQNIPIRTELGKEIRGLFVAPEGRMLISLDYSQIDLRVMAHVSQDPLMLDDFRKGVDFHSATAARVLHKKLDDVTKDDRRIAKTVNFGVLYGLSPFGLSETLGISRDMAAKFIDNYFSTYSGVAAYLEETVRRVRQDGFVETGMGRRRYITGLSSHIGPVRSGAEREAINLPIQGTSADIMRIAMDDIYHYALGMKGSVDLLLQIHDEFLVECDAGMVEKVGRDLCGIMERTVEMSVPLTCGVEYGPSLSEMQTR
ncbi:MAG: DNA polymerase I [Candidatus Dojkabacteria bacterium]|nr:DNA polymerase I [Candidatus Dojkabacteria bacterium]